MDITQSNFEAQLSTFEDSIKRAEFISIDTEFSGKQALVGVVILIYLLVIGYTKGIEDRPNDYETVEERYRKVKE